MTDKDSEKKAKRREKEAEDRVNMDKAEEDED